MSRGNKWGKLEGEEGQVYGQAKRKARVFADRDSESDSERDTYTLEEYQEYLKTLKPGYDSSKSTVRLTPAKLQQLKRVHAKRQGTARADVAPDVGEFVTAIRNRDMKAIKLYSDLNIHGDVGLYGLLQWPEAQQQEIFESLLQIYDVKLLDLVFSAKTFRNYSYPKIGNLLYEMYVASKTPAQLRHFHNMFTYFLDLGGTQLVHNLTRFIPHMVATDDLALMDAITGHEVSFNTLNSPFGKSTFHMALAALGNRSIPFFKKFFTEFPNSLEVKTDMNYYYFPPNYQHPLAIASQNGFVDLVRFLLDNGASPTAKVTSIPNYKSALEVAKNDTIRAILKAHTNKKPEPISGTGVVTNKALKRIMRDWKEVMDDPPSDTVRAFPDESNMFEWHVVLTPPSTKHPLRGVNFHFVMKFPKNYPESPPNIEGSQFIRHPNYFGGWLCLNMLREPTTGSKYSGWSSAYSALSVLMQLQSFLFDKEVDQDYGGSVTNEHTQADIEKSYIDCIRFKCKKCGFNHTWKGFEIAVPKLRTNVGDAKSFNEKVQNIAALPFMGAPEYGNHEDPSQQAPKKQKSKFTSDASLVTLPGAELLLILDLLVRPEDLWSMLKVCKHVYRVGEKYGVWTRRELVCYYSKVSFQDDVLGVGLSVQRNPSGKIKTISSPMDYISKTAFFHDYLRSSAWMEPFDYWLPLVINDKHMQKALPYMKASIVAMLLKVSFDVDQFVLQQRREGNQVVNEQDAEDRLLPLAAKFDPLMVLDILPKLMNHTIVSMMRPEGEKGDVMLHHSEKALLGYCSYHHMLLEMCKRYPVIQQKIDNVLQQFCRHESARVKLAQPDLGELLVYLSVATNVTWRHLGIVFLQELFDRNVVWMLDNDSGGAGHGELAYLETDPVSQYRLSTTFNSSLTGKRLLMFQVFFLEKVGRPRGLSRKDVLQRLNDSYGRPQPGVPYLLQKECEKIYNVKSYPEFFERIGIPCPSKEGMCNILKEAVQNSERKGYHVNYLSQEQLLSWRRRVDTQFSLAHPALSKEAFPSPKTTSSPSPSPSQVPTTTPSPSPAPPAAASTSTAKSNGASAPVKIFVGNLSYRVTALDLEYVFMQFGKLVSSEIKYDDTGKSRGFGYIEVENDQIATTLLEFMQGTDVDRRPVRLETVLPREKRPYNTPPLSSYYNNKNMSRHEREDNRNGRERTPTKSSYNSAASSSSKQTTTQSSKPTQTPSNKTKSANNGKKNLAAQNPFANLDEE